MADDAPAPRPTPSGSRGGRSRPSTGGRAGGGGGSSGRNRGGSGGGRGGSGGGGGGGGGRNGSGRGASGGGGGGRNGAGANGGRNGGRSRNGGRPSQPSRGAGQRSPQASGTERVPASAPVRTTAGRPSDDDALAAANGRRALTWAAVWSLGPAVVAGAVAGVVAALVAGTVVGVVAAVVVALAGWSGLVAAIWRRSDGFVLRAIGARPAEPGELPRVENLVDGLCATMGLARPDLAVVHAERPNAMSVGRVPGAATLVVTDAVEASLSVVELEGLLAHELVHIKRRDTALAAVVVATAAPRAALGLADADAVHRAVGGDREYRADQRAAAVVRYPPGLGSVLTAAADAPAVPWPPGAGRTAALTRWLWLDPVLPDRDPTGQLDLPVVRAAALAEW